MPKKFALRADCRQDACAPSQTWRVFCAIELSDGVRRRVIQHIARLKEAVPEALASWSRDANLHLTIKFLGEIPPISVQNLSAAASRAVEGLAPFRIRLEQTGVFPRHGPPRVLWIGINDLEGTLGELHARLEDECEKEGFQREQRPFHPHLTLARLRKPQHARTLASAHEGVEFEPVEIIVSDLLLIRSEMRREGSEYSIISRNRLVESDRL